MSDDMWLEAASRVHAEVDDELRDEAREVFHAEAARVRVPDLRGDVRITVRCGQVLAGRIARERVDGHLVLAHPDGLGIVIPIGAVVRIEGARPALRDESAGRVPSIGAWLRQRWMAGESVRALDRLGGWHVGAVAFVGADHVRVGSTSGEVTIPAAAVDAWIG